MIDSYFKVALNNLLNNKVFTFINIAGLATGMLCFMLIMLYVRHELSFDQQYQNAENIYRISQQISSQDGTPDIRVATNSPNVAPLLQQEQPQLAEVTRLTGWRTWIAQEGSEPINVQAGIVDPNFPRVFDFQWLEGSPAEALTEPDTIVLTENMAARLFGDAPALGNVVELQGSLPARVTGVIADLPDNTHLVFNMLASMSYADDAYSPNVLENWSAQYFHTYLLLQPGGAIESINDGLDSFVARHLGEDVSQFMSFIVMPITDIHLHSTLRSELKAPGNSILVYALLLIAIIILLVACINFINLATSRATQRAREIGVRKAIGGSRRHLILQFLGETVMMTFIALVLALALLEVLLPYFNSLLNLSLQFSLLDNLPLLAVVVILVGVVAGLYPAVYMSSFSAALVLRGDVTRGKTGIWLRKSLVVVQFSAAVALLICTAVIYAQVAFVRTLDLGYDREGVVAFNTSGAEGVGRNWDLIKQELLSHPGVLEVTAANNLPTAQVSSTYGLNYEGGAETRSMPVMLVDFDYFETYRISLLEGRSFSSAYGEDQRPAVAPEERRTTGTYILSALAARQLGWSNEEALGKWVEITCCGMGQGTVVGVVEDVRYGSLQNALDPVVYAIPPEPASLAHQETRLGLRGGVIRISGQNITAELTHLDAVLQRLKPGQPVNRYFVDEAFESLYRSEVKQGQLLALFAVMAIFICCLGLYGLSSFNAQLRTKEIGVRKVMGSSVWRIVLLLTSDFSKLVLISNVLAWPVAYITMNRWLENFAYRIDLTPMIFIGSGLIALCIAWITVGGTAAKAARARPVLALRYE